VAQREVGSCEDTQLCGRIRGNRPTSTDWADEIPRGSCAEGLNGVKKRRANTADIRFFGLICLF